MLLLRDVFLNEGRSLAPQVVREEMRHVDKVRCTAGLPRLVLECARLPAEWMATAARYRPASTMRAIYSFPSKRPTGFQVLPDATRSLRRSWSTCASRLSICCRSWAKRTHQVTRQPRSHSPRWVVRERCALQRACQMACPGESDAPGCRWRCTRRTRNWPRSCTRAMASPIFRRTSWAATAAVQKAPVGWTAAAGTRPRRDRVACSARRVAPCIRPCWLSP